MIIILLVEIGGLSVGELLLVLISSEYVHADVVGTAVVMITAG
jgi:hypothetical protein